MGQKMVVYEEVTTVRCFVVDVPDTVKSDRLSRAMDIMRNPEKRDQAIKDGYTIMEMGEPKTVGPLHSGTHYVEPKPDYFKQYDEMKRMR